MSEVIDREDERMDRLFRSLDRASKGIQELAFSYKPVLGGEHYLTDSEVAVRLKVSRRTLQEWRNNGLIAYFILGGKVLYVESDIQAMLEKRYYKAW